MSSISSNTPFFDQKSPDKSSEGSQCLVKGKENLRVFNVCLDLDEVVVSLHARPQWIGLKTTYTQIAAFYMRKGCILSPENVTHYVHPAIVEFIRLLCQIDDLKLSFFSAAPRYRNEPFVASLLQHSLGDEKYEEIRDKVLIFSENHLSSRKKKLSAILHDPIEDAVLIDNDPSNRAEKEEDNFLYAPTTDTGDFSKLELKQEKYDSKGIARIKCFINSSVRKIQISANWHGESLKIRFWHKELREFQEIGVSKVTETELYDLLKPYMKSNNFQLPINSPILDKLYEFVRKHGGQTETICHRANRIYLITALLLRALNQARSSNAPLTRFLPRIQTKWNSAIAVEKSAWMSDDELYLEGLQELRSINPSLEFIHPHNYIEAARAPLTEDERCFIGNAIEHEPSRI